jgi:hypothetical protein
MGELLVTPGQVAAAWPQFTTLVTSADQTELIADASQEVLDFTRRPGFIQTFLTETLDGNGLARLWLSMRPIITVAAITVDGIALDNTGGFGWLAKPGTGMLLRGGLLAASGVGRSDVRFDPRWPHGTQNVVVQYWGGYIVVPPPVVRATIWLVQYMYRRGLVTGVYKSESIGDYSYEIGLPLVPGTLPDYIAALLANYVQDDGPL